MLTSILISGVMLGAATHSHTPALIVHAQQMGYHACAHEDSLGPCYWDATTQGNHKGRSFVVTDDGEVFFSRYRHSL